ncbi:hypothetical protein [Shewanella sp. TC10]|uniref:hypothetical protein n=1 Tax=Shewanella sp. TC10 TaxID=1419739 RepID=UPI00129E5F4E|nr:hypothetical protein [Shewanella sp. TC10]
MEWFDLDTVKSISIIITIWVAVYGIDAWRREHVGKRQIELAEDTLALFYEAVDVIKHIRHPMSYANETDEITQLTNESNEQYEARKSASVVFVRYQKNQELFNRLHASRYRFMAQLGKEKAKPFDDIRAVTGKIIGSARMLSKLWARNHFRTDERWESHQKDVDKFEAIFWEGISDEDPINEQLDQIIIEIEKTCKVVIEGQGTLHSFLNMKMGKNS